MTKRVLVIDDDPDTVAFLSAWLEDEGYEVSSALDGAEGMELISRLRPDLVLLDLQMPTRTGVGLYRELVAHDSLRRIPVIFITGLVDYQMFDDACSPLPEPSARIDKPIDTAELRAAIERAFAPVC